jgi:hypothetical protein
MPNRIERAVGCIRAPRPDRDESGLSIVHRELIIALAAQFRLTVGLPYALLRPPEAA